MKHWSFLKLHLGQCKRRQRPQKRMAGMYRYQFFWFWFPFFLCKFDPHHLVWLFITALEGLTSQSNAQTKPNFIEVETIVQIKSWDFSEQLNQWHNLQRRAGVPGLTPCRFWGGTGSIYSVLCICTAKIINLLIQGNFLNNFVVCCQSLDQTAQSMITIWLNPVHYQFL